MPKVKSINSLMKYLRSIHNISISGTHHKRQLRNLGYYHGYKGYRFINKPQNRIHYSNFNEVIALNQFDMQLKSLFYPHIMFIETAIKNYVLEVILDESHTEDFNIIYDTLLNDYQTYSVGSQNYKKALQKRLRVRNQFYNVLTREYSTNKQIVKHFYHNNTAVPIWAIFEVISMGEFGNFISCLNFSTRCNIASSLKLNISCNTDGKLVENIIYLLKDLRNSIAHNDVIFDTRFRSGKPKNSLITSLSIDTGIRNINFKTIVDYLILIAYILKNLGMSKTDLKVLVNKFNKIIADFRSHIPISTYSQILHTDTRNKLIALNTFINI